MLFHASKSAQAIMRTQNRLDRTLVQRQDADYQTFFIAESEYFVLLTSLEHNDLGDHDEGESYSS